MITPMSFQRVLGFPRLLLLLFVMLAGLPPAGRAQAPAAGDTETPEALLKAFYESNSGRAGEHHDWTRFRALFLPGARIVAVVRDKTGRTTTRSQSVDEYIQAATPNLEKNGFAESELRRREERYGDVVQAWSAYEAKHGTGTATVTIRGVNSFQLARVEGRWGIVNLLWTNDRSAGPVPGDLLKSPGQRADEVK
jgi:hypothetical protein